MNNFLYFCSENQKKVFLHGTRSVYMELVFNDFIVAFMKTKTEKQH